MNVRRMIASTHCDANESIYTIVMMRKPNLMVLAMQKNSYTKRSNIMRSNVRKMACEENSESSSTEKVMICSSAVLVIVKMAQQRTPLLKTRKPMSRCIRLHLPIQRVWGTILISALTVSAVEVPFTLAFDIDISLHRFAGILTFLIDLFLCADIII